MDDAEPLSPEQRDELSDALAIIDGLLRQIRERMADISAEGPSVDGWLDALGDVGRLWNAFHVQAARVGRALGLSSARARLQQYLIQKVGQVVNKDELAGVAGATEWARRVRELSLEEGWPISAGPDVEGLRPGQYRLEGVVQDADAAERWKMLNTIRRQPGSGSERCLTLLRSVYPKDANKEDLAHVARIQEWPRRMRELEEAGWQVVSSLDDPSLAPGSYRLDSLEQGPPRPRESIRRRQEILQRDNWTCQRCGATPASDPSVRLQVHHKHHVAHGGTNEDENLVTLCVPCHAGEHALSLNEVADELLNPGADPLT